jgi:hypothetical protein
MKPKLKGFLESGKEYPPLDSGLLEKFFDFCAKFSFGRNHMWLGESIGPGSPFIQDALRPDFDLGYHLQHRLPRKQLQAEAAIAASALQSKTATVDSLAELGPVKVKSSSGTKTQTHPVCDQDDLRIMKKTRMPPKEQELSVSEDEAPKAKVSDLTKMVRQRQRKEAQDDEVIKSGAKVPSCPPNVPKFARRWVPPCDRETPPWRDGKMDDGASSPSTKPPSEVDIGANDVGCSSREMSE